MTIVFLDLDGTLTDAGEGILNSVDYALRKLSLPGLSGDNRWIVGPPLWPSFATAYTWALRRPDPTCFFDAADLPLASQDTPARAQPRRRAA